MGSEQNLREPGGGEGPAPKPPRPGDPLPVLYEGQRGEDRWVRIGFTQTSSLEREHFDFLDELNFSESPFRKMAI